MSFDIASLRTLIAITESGSFQAAATRVHRSVSAVSQQMDKISQIVGTPIFVRHGRRMVLSPSGHALLPFARRMIAEENAALRHLHTSDVATLVRFGCVQDFSDHLLHTVLESYAVEHGSIQLEIEIARSRTLAQKIEEGALDLALHEVNAGTETIPPLFSTPMLWIARRGWAPQTDSIPLIVFDSDCPFRMAAMSALERHGVKSHICFSSPSLSGLKAAVKAGLGVTVRTGFFLDTDMRQVPTQQNLPNLPDIAYGLHFASHTPSEPVLNLADRTKGTLKSVAALFLNPPAGL